jgi:hypothetical protein
MMDELRSFVIDGYSSEGIKLANDQIELEAESRKVVEHSFGIAAVVRPAVSANALLNCSIDQVIFAAVERLVERALDRVAIELLQRKLARQPGSSYRLHAKTMACVALGKAGIVNVTHFFQTANALIDEGSIRPRFLDQSLAQLHLGSRAGGKHFQRGCSNFLLVSV